MRISDWSSDVCSSDLTRGKFARTDRAVVPFRYDGVDADAVIRWIARQPWSDGRVGMYGSDYAGFAAWAATKSLPKALKAIATVDPMAPGISFPMEGHIFRKDRKSTRLNSSH